MQRRYCQAFEVRPRCSDRWLHPSRAMSTASTPPPLTGARRAILRRAFQKLDLDHDGQLTASELRASFSGLADNRVQGGELTETQAFAELLSELLPDGSQHILQDEWEQYFASKHAALNDDAFCTKVSRMWGGLPFVTQKRVDGLEAKLLDSLSSQGAEREVLTRIFRKYDSNEDGLLQLDEFEQFCGAFGLSQAKCSSDEIRALFERYDLDDSGELAFREFSAAMLRQAEGHRPR